MPGKKIKTTANTLAKAENASGSRVAQRDQSRVQSRSQTVENEKLSKLNEYRADPTIQKGLRVKLSLAARLTHSAVMRSAQEGRRVTETEIVEELLRTLPEAPKR